MSKIRIAVIGAGSFACRRHIPDIISNEDAELVAICRRDKTLLHVVGKHFNLQRSQRYENYEAMLDNERLDAVVVTSPHGLHFTHAMCCLERGLHVLVEKPITTNPSQARELIAAAKELGKVLVVGLNPPYWPHSFFVRSLIRAGTLGTLEAASLVRLDSCAYIFGHGTMPQYLPGVVKPTLFRASPELSGGGYFMDTGNHLIAEILFTLEQDIMEVTCLMDRPMDLNSVLSLRLKNDALCTIRLSANTVFPRRRIHSSLFGSEGSIFIEGPPITLRISFPDKEPSIISEETLQPVMSPVEDLIDCIKTSSCPLSSGELGRRVIDVIDAAYLSSREGRTVLLNY